MTRESPDSPQGAEPGRPEPRPDPWKSFGAVMAATLLLEAIVVLLAIPVVGAVGGGLTAASLTYLIGLALLLVLLGGLQRRPWAIWMNLGAQALHKAIRNYAINNKIDIPGLTDKEEPEEDEHACET